MGMEKWREDPDEELAQIFKRSELSTFWTTNISLIIEPGETLIWIRDGQIEETVTQTRLNNVAGGFRNWIASKSSAGKDIQMMIIDNKPFDIVIGADGHTKDNVEQSGIAKLTMRLNHEQANRLTGVLKEKAIKETKGFFRKREVITGYETKLTRTDIEQMMAAEARAKVFGPVIKNFESKDFGSRQLVGKVESAAQAELRKTMELWGMSLENIYVEWNRNAYQDWKTERAPNLWEERARRESEVEEAVHTETVTDIGADGERERLRKDSEIDIGIRAKESELDLDIRAKKSDQDMNELGQLMKMKEQINLQKIERTKSEADSGIELEKVKAEAQVESAKHNLDTYKDAQTAESEKMLRMMEIMQGKKKKEEKEEE
jgi:hypothetical protein|tara:strand:- start:75 stop:1202 length:1128 start_codon:yes stop_codon:yes gene_type:complete